MRCFLNHPTLEPAITAGNEALLAQALSAIELPAPAAITPEDIDDLFRTTARARKGEFAYALAGAIKEALDAGSAPVVPNHIEELFSYLYAADTGTSEIPHA